MSKYFVIAYLENKVIHFYRTTSGKLLNKKIGEIHEKNLNYSVLRIKGFDLKFE